MRSPTSTANTSTTCAKADAAPPACKEAAVVATSGSGVWMRRLRRALARRPHHLMRAGRALGVVGGVMAAGGAYAVDLPEDRADAMYHFYDGGGTRADGPALLIRKKVADRLSISGSYFIDSVSNA